MKPQLATSFPLPTSPLSLMLSCSTSVPTQNLLSTFHTSPARSHSKDRRDQWCENGSIFYHFLSLMRSEVEVGSVEVQRVQYRKSKHLELPCFAFISPAPCCRGRPASLLQSVVEKPSCCKFSAVPLGLRLKQAGHSWLSHYGAFWMNLNWLFKWVPATLEEADLPPGVLMNGQGVGSS